MVDPSPPNDPVSPTEAAVLVAFLKRWNADRASGATRSLAEYQAEFPGYEVAVAREYAAIDAESLSSSAGADEPPSPSADALVGGLRGQRYRELGEIGRGGMAVVFDMWDDRLRRSVAMKVLGSAARPGSAPSPANPSRSLRRFLDEAWITGRLSHPGIVPVHDLGIDEDGRPFFTMPRIEGESLRKLIARSVCDDDPEWPLARLLGVVLRVCEAVASAHAEGVVHRDLKPANIMVGAFGETYVLDWGLARVGESRGGREGDGAADTSGSGATNPQAADTPDRTLAGDVIGTPAYMAPEQARGEVDAVGPLSDVYAVGAIIYHAVCGEPPYSGSTSHGVLDEVVGGPPRALDSFAMERGSPEIVAICSKAMARDPRARYPSMVALADDLRAFLELRVVAAYETGPVAEARKWIRRNRGLTLMGAAAILALVVGLGIALVQRSAAESSARQSDADFEFAHTVVDDMVRRVAESDLVDVPGTELVRAEVLGRALSFYRELLKRRSSSPRVRLLVSRALCDIADAERDLGRYEDAERHFIESVQEARSVFESEPIAVATATTLGISLTRLGSLHRDRGRLTDAIRLIEEALAVMDRALRALGDNAELLRQKGSMISMRGAVISRAGSWEETIEDSREILDVARRAIAIDPDHEGSQDLSVTALLNIASAYSAMEQYEEGRPAIREAIALIEAWPEVWESRDRRVKVSAAFDLLSTFTMDLDPEEARDAMARAVAIARSLVEEFPAIANYHYHLGRMLRNASFTFDEEDHLPYIEESVKAYEDALALAPESSLFEQKLATARRMTCEALLRTGEHQRIAELAKRVDAAKSGAVAEQVAVWFVQCALLAQRDGALSDEKREALAGGYVRKSVETLERAFDAGVLETLDREEFEMLADRDDYRELQRKLAR